MMKGISHLEYYPEQKIQFQMYVGYLILAISIISILIIFFRTARRADFFNRIWNSSNQTIDPTIKEYRATVNKLIFLSMNMILSIIWSILLNVIIYQGLHQLLVNFFTEGSTVQNFLSQAVEFILFILYFMILIILIRYILFMFITSSKETLKRLIKRDINQIIALSLFIIIGVSIGQNIPIDLLH